MIKVLLVQTALKFAGELLREKVIKKETPKTMTEWLGDEVSFGEEMRTRGAVLISDPNERVWLYVDPKTSDTVGIRMRWPNRQYCYLVGA